MSSTVEPPVYQCASSAFRKVDLVYIAMIKYSNRTYTQSQNTLMKQSVVLLGYAHDNSGPIVLGKYKCEQCGTSSIS